MDSRPVLRGRFTFIPCVVEASGGAWSSDARRVWRTLARASARLTGERPEALTERFTQSLSITLHRANARSILRCDGARGAEGRRPADVFLPRWEQGRPAALDLAVTSGLQVGTLEQSAVDGVVVAAAFCDRKCNFMDSRPVLRGRFTFIPCVVEASGGAWSSDARRVWRTL
eukprot:gene6172-2418_t